MKFRFHIVYRLGLALLLIIACWSLWANAEQAPATNAAAVGGGTSSTNEFQAPTFGLESFNVLRVHKVAGQPLWKYAASLIYIVLACCVAWLLDFIVCAWLGRVAARTRKQSDELLLKLLRGPIKVVAIVILLNIGLSVFDWPARAQLMLSRGLIVAVAFSVTYMAIQVVDLLLGLWRDKVVLVQDRAFAAQLFPLLSKLANVAIIIAAAVLTADNLDIRVTSLLAGLSIGGLALGLAAQDTVANLFGAVSIFLDKPFYLGDFIKVEGVNGTVESIGLRSTRIRNGDGHQVTVPNKTMGNAIITNVTRRPGIHTEMNLRLSYETPSEKVKRAGAIIEEVFRANPKTLNIVVGFNKFTESALNIFVGHDWAGTDDNELLARMQEWNLEIKQRFEAEKIEFALPTQTVRLKSDAVNWTR